MIGRICRITIYFLLSSILLSGNPLLSRTRPETVDRDYLVALAVANKFLTAWQTQDQETAALLLDDHLREPVSEDKLQSLFAPPSGGQSAYEINRGRKLAPGRYEFPITLFRITAASPKKQQPKPTTLVVVHADKNDWLIDKLP
jgi:hypothetical protein